MMDCFPDCFPDMTDCHRMCCKVQSLTATRCLLFEALWQCSAQRSIASTFECGMQCNHDCRVLHHLSMQQHELITL